MPGALDKIGHIVVVMLENRSFDNMLGFLYAGENNSPPRKLPMQSPPTFAGLTTGSDMYWNPANPEFFSQGAAPDKVFATAGTTGPAPFQVPDPDPNEAFANFNFQLFGDTATPGADQTPTMLGFLVDYQTAKGSNPDLAGQIMQSYSPEQVPVLSELARNYAVSDAWFASAPAQTWPNRAFMHAGTARGEVTNGNVWAYATKTIFEVLENVGADWAIYKNTELPSLTQLQYPLLTRFLPHIRHFSKFQSAAKNGSLPRYSFIEPSFFFQPDDQHPPHDVALGEQFIWDVWTALTSGPKWNETLLVITYDEHGGCYDHVPPPWGAATPDAASNPGMFGFRFDRFGVRVPCVVISPYIEPGTVFRSPAGVPCDHTTILATLRDWLSIPPEWMLPSQRVSAAPTLEFLLTRDEARADLPAIPAPARPKVVMRTLEDLTRPLNDLQFSMLVAVQAAKLHRDLIPEEISQLRQHVPTKGLAQAFFKAAGLLGPV
jgi:phospholipase C